MVVSVESILQVCFFHFFILLFCSVRWHIQLLSYHAARVSRGNDGTPHSPTVSASLLKYPEDRKRWIDAIPNKH